MDVLFGGSVLDTGSDLVAPFSIPKLYGFVLIVEVASVFMLFWLGVQVKTSVILPLFK